MIFSKSRPVKIVLVGTGGTGGYIVPQLYRLLYALDRPIRVILCDGDLVEEKNLGRQNFIEADLGKNKAMVLAERYSNAFGIETSYIPQYVEDEEMLEAFRRKKKVPIKALAKRLGMKPKVLEDHRRYLVAAVLVHSGDYPFIREYIRLDSTEGGEGL